MNALRESWSFLSSILGYELLTFDSHSITLGTCIAAVALVTLGIRISRMLSRAIIERWTSRFNIKQGEAEAYRVLLFYALVVICALIALHLLHVPLGIFTLFGGAVAIGVGFGSQNLINNFISGLILLFERPIRVGDLIAIDGREGYVTQIGPRSTRIRTFDHTVVILPNSQLLERAVVNSVLGDPRTRFSMQIGFAYGSDLALTQKVLLEALTSTAGILEDPAPNVHLQDFADNAVVFRLYYYINLEDARSRFEIESDVRFAVAHLAARHQLHIPFPQRTLSTAANGPLEVRVIKSA